MLPNIPPKLFSLSAVAVGYILVDDMKTANEQNALGNWLMLVAQVISTNAFYKAVKEDNTISNTGKNNSFTFGKSNTKEETLEMLKKMRKAIDKEIDNIRENKY